MPHHLPLIIAAAAGWVAGLTGIALLVAVFLDRALTTWETALAGGALLAVVTVIVRGRLRRQRRKLQDMRDSALW